MKTTLLADDDVEDIEAMDWSQSRRSFVWEEYSAGSLYHMPIFATMKTRWSRVSVWMSEEGDLSEESLGDFSLVRVFSCAPETTQF